MTSFYFILLQRSRMASRKIKVVPKEKKPANYIFWLWVKINPNLSLWRRWVYAAIFVQVEQCLGKQKDILYAQPKQRNGNELNENWEIRCAKLNYMFGLCDCYPIPGQYTTNFRCWFTKNRADLIDIEPKQNCWSKVYYPEEKNCQWEIFWL